MNDTSFPTDCHEVSDRLDAFLDGDLDRQTVDRFNMHIESCTRCSEELALARQITSAFGDIEPEPCPDDVFARAVEQSISSDHAPVSPAPRRPARLIRWQPAALAASILLVLGLSSLPFLLHQNEPEYSAEEIAEAREQLELAFQIVNDAGRKTGVFLQHDVIGEEVVRPIQRSVTSNL